MFIAATSATKWTEYRRLTKLIDIGMERDEVSKALGAPEKVDILSVGERWLYFEDEPTAGWLYVAEFRRDPKTGILKLCYIFNKQHTVFPGSPMIEIGERLKETEHQGSVIGGYPPTQKE